MIEEAISNKTQNEKTFLYYLDEFISKRIIKAPRPYIQPQGTRLKNTIAAVRLKAWINRGLKILKRGWQRR